MVPAPDLEAQLAQLEPGVRLLIEEALAAIERAGPGAEMVLYNSRRPASRSMMWKLVRYRSGGAWVAGVGAFTQHAALFFYEGRSLADPAGLLAGSGRSARFISLRRPGDANRPEVTALLKEAFGT